MLSLSSFNTHDNLLEQARSEMDIEAWLENLIISDGHTSRDSLDMLRRRIFVPSRRNFQGKNLKSSERDEIKKANLVAHGADIFYDVGTFQSDSRPF